MDQSLIALKSTLKKIVITLKSSQQSLSFLLLLGPTGAGKTSVLKQSPHEYVPIETLPGIEIYYNPQGIILEINEDWLSSRQMLLSHTLKELNQTHHRLKITGIIYALNINDFYDISSEEMVALCQHHAKKIQNFSTALGKKTDVALLFTQIDGLAGFTDFFQHTHASELERPFGFSIDWVIVNQKISNNFKTKFDHWIHSLEQEVLQKIHPVRSSVKRLLIREFPLQLHQLRQGLYTLLSSISPNHARVKAIYFTSAEQGGTSTDHLTQKIQQHYPIAIPHLHPQSTNYKPYFIRNTLLTFQHHTLYHRPVYSWKQKIQGFGLAALFGVSLAFIYHQHQSAKETLNKISQEWHTYDNDISSDALYTLQRLANSNQLLQHYPKSLISSKAIEHLQWMIEKNKMHAIKTTLIPFLIEQIEHALNHKMSDPLSQYDPLKAYVMLAYPEQRDLAFFKKWLKKQLKNEQKTFKIIAPLLDDILIPSFPAIAVNHALINDTRNYLKALPKNYLYYAISKQYFEKKSITFTAEGFLLPTHSIPTYLTKAEFDKTLALLSDISTRLKETEWVLNDTLPPHLLSLLQESYCNEYISWWKKFEEKIKIMPFKGYEDAHHLIAHMKNTHSLERLTQFLQLQTQPDFQHPNHLFNQWIANQFTPLNLISLSKVREFNQMLSELQPFLMTFAVAQDKGRSAFLFSKDRFENNYNSSPLAMLYQESNQFPAPLSGWISSLADQLWYLIMRDTKEYINEQWIHQVIQPYDQTIAKYYPFSEQTTTDDVSIEHFSRFFANNGLIQQFIKEYLAPYLNTEQAAWHLKTIDHYQLPIAQSMLDALMHANIITHMFFPDELQTPQIQFTIQKLSLDPIIQKLQLTIGKKQLIDTQQTEEKSLFQWPASDAELTLITLEGEKYRLSEKGMWAFFKMLQTLNTHLNEEDPSQLDILFEINGNAGRYVLKTQSALNPFTPDILSQFRLTSSLMTN